MSQMTIRNLSLAVGDRQILDAVTVPIEGLTWLIGPSGAGKTSVLDTLGGLLPRGARVSGELVLGDEIISLGAKAGARQLAKLRRTGALGWAPQNAADTFPPHLKVKNFVDHTDLVRLFEVQSHLLQRTPTGLSGGQLSRISLAAALQARPRLLVADEPTAGLENQLADAVVHVLNERANQGLGTIAATHDVGAVERASRRFPQLRQQIVLLRNGRVQEVLPVRKFCAVEAETEYARAFARAMPSNGAHVLPEAFDDEVKVWT